MFCEYLITFFLLKYALCHDPSYGVNVGTVLFTESDNTRKCWSNEELALLRARLVFQDVLPKTSALVMEDDQFVAALVSYFRLSVERVKVMTAGKVQEINMKALTDTIGGYLHHVVIPLGKHSFYAGKITYNSARQLTELCDEMKIYLRTDGHSWTPALKTPNKVKREAAPPGNAPPPPAASGKGSSGACGDLVYSHPPNGPVTVPMPFLDSNTKPTSIAVPFKAFPLRNLQSKSSASVLVKYYETSVACMKEQGASPADITKFNHDFSAFLDSSILPHMNDEELYPAFGGILKLKDTLDHGGQPAGGPGALGAYGVESGGAANNTTDESDYFSDEDKSTTIMFAAVAVVILIWIITGIIYCCCRMRRKKRDHDKHGTPSKRGSSKASRVELVSSECPNTIEKKVSKEKMKQNSHESIKQKHSPQAANKPAEKEREKEKEIKEKITKPNKKPEHRKSGGVCPVKGSPIPPVPTREPAKPPPKPGKPAPAKPPPKEVVKEVKCPQCKRTKCGHGLHIGSALIKNVRSAPVSLKKGGPFMSEKLQISSTSQTSAEKPVVFGYDFETSSTDSSSIGESCSSSGDNTPNR